MNPFDLPGPQFLFFYIVLSLAVIAALAYLRRLEEGADGPLPQLDDPYLVAYLRNGAREALRVATMSLIDRGLLRVEPSVPDAKERLVTKEKESVDLVKRPIEKEILRQFQAPAEARSLKDIEKRTGRPYARTLEQMGLTPSKQIRATRRAYGILAAGVVIGVAVLKIVIALSRGRTNVEILILLAAVFAWLVIKLANPPRTTRGDRLLQDLKNLFAGLKDRVGNLRAGGDTNELAWMAAVFGPAAVPLDIFPYPSLFARKREPGGEATGSYSCGSSCGSSCGGGCGGGCGGCGGD